MFHALADHLLKCNNGFRRSGFVMIKIELTACFCTHINVTKIINIHANSQHVNYHAPVVVIEP